MKKPLRKATLRKETLLWGRVRNAMKRDDIRVCRK